MNSRSIILLACFLILGACSPSVELSSSRAAFSDAILEVVLCDTENISSGEVVLSAYGNNVLKIDEECKASGVLQVEGPINVFNPLEKEDEGWGIGLVYGRPMIYDERGSLIYDGRGLIQKIRQGLPKDVVNAYFHHDVIRTKWGTLMALLAHVDLEGRMDDLIIEFNEENQILSQLSLNELIFNDKWGARGLSHPYKPEDWLHTNSIDTSDDGSIIVSTRNLNEIQVIDWKSKTIINKFGSSELSLQHYARYQPDGTILVFDNGAVKKESGIAIYSATGNILEYYSFPFFASAYGSIQKLQNGNWLTINGTSGEIYEYTSDLSKKVMHIRYKSKDWIPFQREYQSILYRAIKIHG